MYVLRDFRVECVTCGTVFFTNKVDKLTCGKECRIALLKWRQRRKVAVDSLKEQRKSAKKAEKPKAPKLPSKASMRPDYDKWKARKAVELALRYGRIMRPETCSGCGSDKHIQAHHIDYKQPLNIEWLCKRCHTEADKLALSVSPLQG